MYSNLIMQYFLISLLVFLSGYASAHEWTPTYPEVELSHIPNVSKVEMRMFNTREDIRYYQVSVFDSDWEKVPFALANGRPYFEIKHNVRKEINVFIRNEDLLRAVYVCSMTKPLAENVSKTMLFSRVCSKIK